VSVEDPPLEDVIASLFSLTEKQMQEGADANVAATAATIAAVNASTNGAKGTGQSAALTPDS
jgi:hypothetical protein